MGYYTDYTLDVEGEPDALHAFSAIASNREETFDDYHPLDYFIKGTQFNAKWYYWKDDMTALSKRFPALLFIIDGIGEEHGDMWRAYCRNGKIVRVEAELKYPHVDLDKELPKGVMSAEEQARLERIAELEQQKASLNEELQTLRNKA